MSLVSIIIPCFNYGSFLGETLHNLQKQTYSNWECIIVNDGSIDNTEEVAIAHQKADSRFTYIYQHNAGVSEARNKGLAVAEGKYIQFLDADDLLSPQKLELHVSYLEQYENVDLVYSNTVYFQNSAPELHYKGFDLTDQEWLPIVSGKDHSLLQVLLQTNIMAIHAPLLRKRLVQAVGVFDSHLKGMEDWDYWIRCALKGAYFQFDDRESAKVMVRVHSSSASQNYTTMATGELMVRKKLQRYFATNPNLQYLQDVNRHLLHQCSIHVTFNELRCGNQLRGWKNILSAIRFTRKPAFYLKNGIYWQVQRFLGRS